MRKLLFLILLVPYVIYGQLFQDNFNTVFTSISAVNWPTACRGGSASSFNTSIGACAGAGDYEYGMSGIGSYITTSAISIPAAGYSLTFDYSFSNTFSFPSVEIRSGATCGTILLNTVTLSNTSGVCTNEEIDLSAYAGQTIYIRFKSNHSSISFYFDDPTVDLSTSGGGSTCLLDDDFGSGFASISTTNWPTTCRTGSPSSFNTSAGPCGAAGDYSYSMSGFMSITSLALSIPTTGFTLSFDYSFNNTTGLPAVEIRSGGTCGTSLVSTTALSNTFGVCTPFSMNLDVYAGQTIFIRFRSNTSLQPFYLDNVKVCGGGSGSGDYKWADNFNDNDLTIDYPGTQGDEMCTGCSDWTLAPGASLALAPNGGWNGNTNETEAFANNMPNVYYVRLDRNEYIESPVIDMSGKESLKISFYAKSSSPGTGGGDTWSSLDRLKLQIWDGTNWITVQNLRDDFTSSWNGTDDYISSALPFNYYCFTAYKATSSPGNYYYSSSPNVNASYFHSGFKFRVIFEGGFSGAPFAWVDDFTFRADNDGYSVMVPCGLSFWNQPAATSYGQDTGTSGNNNAEKGVELELDNSINLPPLWNTQANDGDVHSQIFGAGEAERVVFCVISEQKISFAFPKVHFYAPDIGWKSAVMSIDNNYTGPGWRYYNVQYISCDLASSTIAAPTSDFKYYYSFEYGIEFMPVFYQLNTSGIEFGGGVTNSLEVFDAPDLTSIDNCGLALPVELISFEAEKSEQTSLLKWITASEQNSDQFVIERADDELNFIEIGMIKAAGSSSDLIQYEWVDQRPVLGNNYYRLKQVDYNGAEHFSNIHVVHFEDDSGIYIYPNPAHDKISLQINNLNEHSVHITDIYGKVLHEDIVQSNHVLLELSIEELTPGTYYVVCGSSSKVFIKN